MRYPPGGTRGYSRTVRAYDYGLRPPEAFGKPLLFAQIESLEALNNVEAIAAVDGVDVLFVGPADASRNRLGCRRIRLRLKERPPVFEPLFNPTLLAVFGRLIVHFSFRQVGLRHVAALEIVRVFIALSMAEFG